MLNGKQSQPAQDYPTKQNYNHYEHKERFGAFLMQYKIISTVMQLTAHQ